MRMGEQYTVDRRAIDPAPSEDANIFEHVNLGCNVRRSVNEVRPPSTLRIRRHERKRRDEMLERRIAAGCYAPDARATSVRQSTILHSPEHTNERRSGLGASGLRRERQRHAGQQDGNQCSHQEPPFVIGKKIERAQAQGKVP